MFANMASHSVEVTEAEQPVQVLRYDLVADRMGPGAFRGGAPYRREYRFLEHEAVLQVRADRMAFGLTASRAAGRASRRRTT